MASEGVSEALFLQPLPTFTFPPEFCLLSDQWWQNNSNVLCLNHPKPFPPPLTLTVEKLSSTKLVPSAKNVGDHCPRASTPWLPGEQKMWNVNTQSSETAWTFLTPPPWVFPLPRSHALFQETVLRRERGSGCSDACENSGVRGPCKVQGEERQVFGI